MGAGSGCLESRAYDGNTMMVHTQISIDAELLKRAKAKAAELGVLLSEYVRTLVEQDLGPEQKRVDVSILFDLGDSRGSDVARYKHKYVGEAVEAEYLKDIGRP